MKRIGIRPRRWRHSDLRSAVYDILDQGPIGNRTGFIVTRLISALIVVNLVAITLQSVPELEARFASLFTAVEIVSLIIFTIEYLARVWVAAEHAPHRHLGRAIARW